MDFSKLFSLEGRTALVTGGSRGIGHMIVEGYLAAGAKRVYISARKVDQVEAAVAEFGDKVVGLPCDISTMEGVQALAGELKSREEGLDILVNNAGAAWGADYDEFPESGWDKVMDLNVKSLFFLTQQLTPLLSGAATFDRPAKVINIASIDGLRINPWQTYSYQASKSAVIHLTRRLAAELIKRNIQVTCIAPGAFPSEMNRSAAKQEAAVAKGIPFARVGTPEDMAGLAIFLASRAGDYIVGETIACDGGIVHAGLPGNSIDPG